MTAEPAFATFVAIDELFHEKLVILVGMEDEYTEHMACVKEYLIHGSYRRGISKHLIDAVANARRSKAHTSQV